MKRESPRALQAFNEFYDLGPGRSLDKLLGVYRERRQSAGKSTVPTTRMRTLEQWSTDHDWVGRCIARAQREADAAEARNAEELAKQKRLRIAEARGLRHVGAEVVRHLIQKLGVALAEREPIGAIESVPYSETKVTEEPQYDAAGNLTGTIRRTVTVEGVRIFRRPGLMDLLPAARKAIEVGQKLERIETGADAEGNLEAWVAELIQGLPPEEQAEMRELARRIAQERGWL